jgi:hypothetical protein
MLECQSRAKGHSRSLSTRFVTLSANRLSALHTDEENAGVSRNVTSFDASAYSFFSSFFTSALIFFQKDSFGAFLQSLIITGMIFSIAST